jgi:hypothetical protein
MFSLMLSPWLLGGNSSPRPVASLSGEERMKLPGETVVKLHSGRIATLAVLRREHELRMQRFKNAVALRKAISAKMNRPLVPAEKNASNRLSTQANPAVTSPDAPASRKIDPNVVLQSMQIAMVQHRWSYKVPLVPMVPIDLAQACPDPVTVCLYVPQGTMTITARGSYADDADPLILDKTICANNGGSINDGECHFLYLMADVNPFTVTGKLSMTGTCDSSFHSVLDPRGAVKVSYNAPLAEGQTLTFQNPVMCAVQVWMTK